MGVDMLLFTASVMLILVNKAFELFPDQGGFKYMLIWWVETVLEGSTNKYLLLRGKINCF